MILDPIYIICSAKFLKSLFLLRKQLIKGEINGLKSHLISPF